MEGVGKVRISGLQHKHYYKEHLREGQYLYNIMTLISAQKLNVHDVPLVRSTLFYSITLYACTQSCTCM